MLIGALTAVLYRNRGLQALKAQEAQFKSTCKAEMIGLEDKIERLEGAGVEIMDDERSQAIAEQYAQDQAKMKKLKLLNARRTREIAGLQRQIDEFPGRGELNQYQRRFVELYAAINTKLRETKQYYTLYNTLDDTKLYLTKENALLESIQENYTVAIQSTSGMLDVRSRVLTVSHGFLNAMPPHARRVPLRVWLFRILSSACNLMVSLICVFRQGAAPQADAKHRRRAAQQQRQDRRPAR